MSLQLLAPRLRRAIAQELHCRGITCGLCDSMISPMCIVLPHTEGSITPQVARELLEIVEPVDKYCEFHRKVNQADTYDDKLPAYSSDAVDGREKQEFMSFLTEKAGGCCEICGRTPDPKYPNRYFNFDHVTCKKREGDFMCAVMKKLFSIASMFIKFPNAPHTTNYKENMKLLKMPFRIAKPLMEAEAGKCRLLCISCHSDVTASQRNVCYDFNQIRADFKRIIEGDKFVEPRTLTITFRPPTPPTSARFIEVPPPAGPCFDVVIEPVSPAANSAATPVAIPVAIPAAKPAAAAAPVADPAAAPAATPAATPVATPAAAPAADPAATPAAAPASSATVTTTTTATVTSTTETTTVTSTTKATVTSTTQNAASTSSRAATAASTAAPATTTVAAAAGTAVDSIRPQTSSVALPAPMPRDILNILNGNTAVVLRRLSTLSREHLAALYREEESDRQRKTILEYIRSLLPLPRT